MCNFKSSTRIGEVLDVYQSGTDASVADPFGNICASIENYCAQAVNRDRRWVGQILVQRSAGCAITYCFADNYSQVFYAADSCEPFVPFGTNFFWYFSGTTSHQSM